MEKVLKQQPLQESRQQRLIIDVHGRTSEPICSYHGCDHKFSAHGLGNCCKPKHKQDTRSIQQISMKEITTRLTDKEYDEYLKKGQSEYRLRMKKDTEDEDYVKWMFMLGEHYRGQRD